MTEERFTPPREVLSFSAGQDRMLEKWARLFVYHDLRRHRGRTRAEASRREFYFLDRRRSGGLVDLTQPYVVGEVIPNDRVLSPPIVTTIQSYAQD